MPQGATDASPPRNTSLFDRAGLRSTAESATMGTGPMLTSVTVAEQPMTEDQAVVERQSLSRAEEGQPIDEWRKCFLQARCSSRSLSFRERLALGSVPSGLRCITNAVRPLQHHESLRLAHRLLFAYAKADLPFPTALFWLVQSSPGLLREWAHVAFEPSVAPYAPRTIADFDAVIASWGGELLDRSYDRRLQLVERFMTGIICGHCLAAALELGIAVTRDVAPRDLPSRHGNDDCPCDIPVAANVLSCFALVPYALHVLLRFLPSTSDSAILKQLKQLFVVLYELGTSDRGRPGQVLQCLRLEAEAAGWSSLAEILDRDVPSAKSSAKPAAKPSAKLVVKSPREPSLRALAEPPVGVSTRAPIGEQRLERFVASALRLSALCKLEAKRRRNQPTLLTVGDLFLSQPAELKPAGATCSSLRHGGTLTVIEATDERMRAMLAGCACDLFPVSVDDIIAKGDVVQRLAALRAHLTVVETFERLRFGVDMDRLRDQVKQISKLTGPNGWSGQDPGILGVDATCTERLKRSGAFARAADILTEAEASLGGHHVRTTSGSEKCNPVVEQLRHAVYALRAARQRPALPQVKRHIEAALRFAEVAEGVALLAGCQWVLVPDSWVRTFTAEAGALSAAASVDSVPTSLDAAIEELDTALRGYSEQQESQQLLLRRRLLGARLLTWVLEHALSTSQPPRGAGVGEDTSGIRALDTVFCSGDAPDVLHQPVAFPHPFPCCAPDKSEEVKAAFLELCASNPKPFLCICADSRSGCDLIAVGASPSPPVTGMPLAASAASAAVAAFAALVGLARSSTSSATSSKRPIVLVEVKGRGAAAAAEWFNKEDLLAGETLCTNDVEPVSCSLMNDVELLKRFEFTRVDCGARAATAVIP